MDLSLNTLKEAVSLREQIHTLERRLASLFGTGDVTTPARSRARRPMAASTRAKLSAAAKANWARRRSRGTLRTTGPTSKGSLTVGGNKELYDGMKCRW